MRKHAVGNIQQSVIGSYPKALVGFSVQPGSARQPTDGVKTHRGRTGLVEVLAVRYPVICRLVGELSFRIVARRFIFSEPPRAEAALVARPFLKVQVRRLPPGGYTFLRALSEGQTVAIAVRAATAATCKFEMASNLSFLIDANVIVGIHEC
jgi:hypothetical protein